MRNDSIRRLALALCAFALVTVVAATPPGASADDNRESDNAPSPTVLDVKTRAKAGERFFAVLRFVDPGEEAPPVLVTPSKEGDALEVVRGRLHTSDATRQDGMLEFRIPIIARLPGHAVFRVRVDTYVCASNPRGSKRCRAIRHQVSSMIDVQEAAP